MIHLMSQVKQKAVISDKNKLAGWDIFYIFAGSNGSPYWKKEALSR